MELLLEAFYRGAKVQSVLNTILSSLLFADCLNIVQEESTLRESDVKPHLRKESQHILGPDATMYGRRDGYLESLSNIAVIVLEQNARPLPW